MRIVVAPDRFAGTLSAVQAADAMAAGWSEHAPGDTVVARPLSDGGAGLLDTLSIALPGQLRSVTVTGPGGDPVPATLLVVAAADDPSGRSSVYVEAAQACGPHLAPGAANDPARTTTRGVGELLRAAVGTGVERVVVGPGTGAPGGLAFALLALGGRRAPGAAVVSEATGLTAALLGSDLVLTGEGTFDWQSLRGSPVTAVAHAAMQAGVPVVVVAGQVTVGRRELAAAGIEAAYPVAERAAQLEAALADPAGTLRARVRRVARTWHRAG